MTDDNLNDLNNLDKNLEQPKAEKQDKRQIKEQVDQKVMVVIKSILLDLLDFDETKPIMPKECIDIVRKHYANYLKK